MQVNLLNFKGWLYFCFSTDFFTAWLYKCSPIEMFRDRLVGPLPVEGIRFWLYFISYWILVFFYYLFCSSCFSLSKKVRSPTINYEILFIFTADFLRDIYNCWSDFFRFIWRVFDSSYKALYLSVDFDFERLFRRIDG